MYGLEYLLFFGVPDNKAELMDGHSRLACPFESRESAEAHFAAWLDTLCRWKGVASKPVVHKSGERWQASVNGAELELFPRPIELRFPLAFEAFDAFHETYNRRDFWPGQPTGFEAGWDSLFDDGDIRMNLWRLFGGLCQRHGGQHCGRVDNAISDTACVSPDEYYFRPGRQNLMIERDYYCAPPDLIAEVLSAPSRALDRGERMELYRRCGVPRLWLLEPALETVEVFELKSQYELKGVYGPGESFAERLFPGEQISVTDLFDTQSKRKGWDNAPSDPEPIAEWLLPSEFRVGLEYFFLLGHPERRWEFWGNVARSVLAFGSAAEARARLDHFLEEACRFEGVELQHAASLSADVDQGEVGRFQLTRQGRLVWLGVAVDGRKHKELLQTFCKRDAWNWGEDG